MHEETALKLLTALVIVGVVIGKGIKEERLAWLVDGNMVRVRRIMFHFAMCTRDLQTWVLAGLYMASDCCTFGIHTMRVIGLHSRTKLISGCLVIKRRGKERMNRLDTDDVTSLHETNNVDLSSRMDEGNR
jgi:hypothetical protein